MTGSAISPLKTPNIKNNRVIDGFINSPSKTADSKNHHQPKSAEYHSRAQRAQTLMRRGLKKPAQRLQPDLHRKKSSGAIERELRAKLTPKHRGVDRFGGVLRPRQENNQASTPPLKGELVNRSQNPTSKAAPAPLPSLVTSASHQKLERLLDEALVHADAHKQALRYQAARHFWQRRWFSGPKRWFLITAVVALLAIGFLLVWQKVPQLSVKAAGLRAHLTAAIPSYEPDGYAMAGPAKAVSGAVMIEYKSTRPDGNSFAIKQVKTNLTSSSLPQTVIPKGAAVQTSQVEGNTVYIYGTDNDAAWINNGVLYTIKDNAGLDSNELIKIVQGINQ